MHLFSEYALVPHLAAVLKAAGSTVLKAGFPEVKKLGPDVSNWESGVTYRPAVVVKPTSIEEVVAIVRDKVSHPSPVRAVGKLHSPAPCSADDGGTMVDMTAMTRILEIGPDFVTAEAGAIYVDVAEALLRHGQQFHINTEIGNVTLGAVACAATKDSSLIGTSHWGQVSSFVTGVKVVTADGSVRTYTQAKHPAELRLLRSSYGLLGIVVEVTLATQPLTAIEAVHRVYTVAKLRTALPELVAQNYAVMMYFYPFSGRILVELRREVPGTWPKSSGGWWIRNAFWRTLAPMFTTWIAKIPHKRSEHVLRGAFDHLIRRGTCMAVRGKLTHPTKQIIRHPDKPGRYKFVFSMWSFEETRFFDVLEEYFAFCREHARRTNFRCDLPAVGYRLMQDKNAHLSFTHDANAMSIDPASTGGPGWDAFLKAFNEFASARGGHPLLNQTKHLTPVQVRRAYGARLGTFERARRAWDPGDRFLSGYFANFLGSTRKARVDERS